MCCLVLCNADDLILHSDDSKQYINYEYRELLTK